mgnify:CR=1 FL=1
MHKPLEKDIQRVLLTYLRSVLGWPVVRINSGGMRRGKSFYRFNDTAGVSDIVGLIPPAGRFLAIEVKRPGGRPTEQQRQWLDAVRAAGGVGLVVTGLDDLRQQLRELVVLETASTGGPIPSVLDGED